MTVVSAIAVGPRSKGSSTRPGVAAEIAERGKERDYPGIPVIGFAVEDHGRIGEKARAFLKAVAPTAQAERVLALRRLYQSLGAAVQRTAADAILAAAGPEQDAAMAA